MLIIKFLLFAFLITFNCCYCQKSPTYRAAVVEVHPTKIRANVKNQLIDIIHSPSLKNVDIIVLPEAILNTISSAILLPNSTVFCDDSNAHPIFRDISCAARRASMYVVIDVYTKIRCSVDDQSFCVNKEDDTNTYNMAFVFDRNGAMIAKYRKFHLWGENVQTPKNPDLVTFQTDFNVTFGVCICFDLLFESPATKLVDNGIRHFVYPTMWPLELPFMNANQMQQMWAYGNDAILLAANANTNMIIANTINPTSGSGIYAGRLTALDVFFSSTPATKILIANVPINLPRASTTQSDEEQKVFANNVVPMENLPIPFEVDRSFSHRYDEGISQEVMTSFTIEFLDFSKRSSHNGTICNGGFCCNYDFDVVDNGSSDKKPSYFYAIMVFSGYRGYLPIPKLFTHQSLCGITACGEMNDRSSCARRFASDVHYRYMFKRLSFTMTPPTYRAKNIMANTLSHDLYPLSAKEFELNTSKSSDTRKYDATLTLKTPKSDLLTFAIYSRDYQMDKLTH